MFELDLPPLGGAQPFLKWVGGKGQLLPILDKYLQLGCKRYIEPFVGGGAVFFYLWSCKKLKGPALLGDANPELINTYIVVRDCVDQLIVALQELAASHSKEFYYHIRTQAVEPGVLGAARTLYLNKTGFNGLYRLNRAGQFNVPMGRYEKPSICNPDRLKRASVALRRASLLVQDFEETMDICGPGDFLYLDPPYVPLNSTSNFTSYSASGFSEQDQIRLRDAIDRASARGATFLLSNSGSEFVERAYSHYQLVSVNASRRVNSNATRRGSIREFLVMP